jgi:hypothetical protein
MRGMEMPRNIRRIDSGRERYMRAVSEIRFESGKWLAQVPGAERALERLVLATAPVSAPPQGAHGIEAIRHLAMDPAYQLK